MRSTIRAAEPQVRIGCAGWSLPRAQWPRFPAEGSHLERYAARLDAVEIDSSFYRPHRRETYARWADSTPADFRFAVKLPKTITHDSQLRNAMPAFDAFRAQVAGLGEKLGCLLIQLAPSHAFDAAIVRRFFVALRQRHAGALALEPRHATWFAAGADALLREFRVARVLADPVLHALGALPGGWPELVYLRLHGTPRVYWSPYAHELFVALAARLTRAQREEGACCWCIFDNTAGGEAIGNALALAAALSHPQDNEPKENDT